MNKATLLPYSVGSGVKGVFSGLSEKTPSLPHLSKSDCSHSRAGLPDAGSAYEDHNTRVKADKVKPGKLSYTIAEAANATGLSRITLWRQVRAGNLDVAKIGRRVLILASSLQSLLEQGRKDFIAGNK